MKTEDKKNNKKESSKKESKNIFRADLPYPEIKVSKENCYYARLILEDFAGYGSETTAITQYIAHHFELDEEYAEIAEVLMGISIVEMDHLHMLGDIIVKLGQDVQFASYDGCMAKPWTADNIYYGCELKDILNSDIQGELGAIKQYENHMIKIKDDYINEVLYRIILDEKVHVKLLKKLYKKYC